MKPEKGQKVYALVETYGEIEEAGENGEAEAESKADLADYKQCGAGWVRVVERVSKGKSYAVGKSSTKRKAGLVTDFSGYDDGSSCPEFKTLGWRPSCGCGGESMRGLVLDPFAGSGTAGVVALTEGRDFIGFDLNPDYCKMANDRLAAVKDGVPTKERRAGQGSLLTTCELDSGESAGDKRQAHHHDG